jgi:hypothetical protein
MVAIVLSMAADARAKNPPDRGLLMEKELVDGVTWCWRCWLAVVQLGLELSLAACSTRLPEDRSTPLRVSEAVLWDSTVPTVVGWPWLNPSPGPDPDPGPGPGILIVEGRDEGRDDEILSRAAIYQKYS